MPADDAHLRRVLRRLRRDAAALAEFCMAQLLMPSRPWATAKGRPDYEAGKARAYDDIVKRIDAELAKLPAPKKKRRRSR